MSREDGRAAVAAWERLHGELTEQEMAEARQRVARELRPRFPVIAIERRPQRRPG